MSLNTVRELIEYLYDKHNVDGIIFQEDNFFANTNRVKDVIGVVESMSKLGWKANSRIDYFEKIVDDVGLMNKIVRSGCKVLQFGVESGSQKIIDMINKGINLEKLIQTNKKLSQYNVRVRYNFIVGFPYEEIGDIELTFKFIETLLNDNLNAEPPFLNIYTPYPGTRLYQAALKLGFVEPSCLEEWVSFNWNTANSTWLPQDVAALIEKRSREYFSKSFYLRKEGLDSVL